MGCFGKGYGEIYVRTKNYLIMTTIEEKFNMACEMKERGFEYRAYCLLYEGYLSYCNNPHILGNVTNYALIGNCLYAFYFMPTIQNSNETIMEQVSSIAVLFLSKAIDKAPQNLHMRSCRIHILNEAREYIKHIFVESEIDIPHYDIYNPIFNERPTRRALTDLDKIMYSELVTFPEITSEQYFASLKHILENDRLVPNRFHMSSIDAIMKRDFSNEGKEFLGRFISFLNQKVCINGDIDFDTEYE